MAPPPPRPRPPPPFPATGGFTSHMIRWCVLYTSLDFIYRLYIYIMAGIYPRHAPAQRCGGGGGANFPMGLKGGGGEAEGAGAGITAERGVDGGVHPGPRPGRASPLCFLFSSLLSDPISLGLSSGLARPGCPLLSARPRPGRASPLYFLFSFRSQ